MILTDREIKAGHQEIDSEIKIGPATEPELPFETL
jgi:hypothetical protein